jgi:hypothetical protein
MFLPETLSKYLRLIMQISTSKKGSWGLHFNFKILVDLHVELQSNKV